MDFDDPLLVGEYEYFPADTCDIFMEETLESLHLATTRDFIGSMKHAEITKNENKEDNSACLHSQENSSQSIPCLNPAAKEFKPTSYIYNPYAPVSSNPASINVQEVVTTNHCSPFVSTCSLSSQTRDTMVTSLSMPKVHLPSVRPENDSVFLNTVSSEYRDERTLPVVTDIPLVPDISEQSNYKCTNYNTYLHPDPEAALSNTSSFGHRGASDEMQMFQSPRNIPVKFDNQSSENISDLVENHTSETGCGPAIKIKTENKSVARSNPRSRMVAVQVRKKTCLIYVFLGCVYIKMRCCAVLQGLWLALTHLFGSSCQQNQLRKPRGSLCIVCSIRHPLLELLLVAVITS